MADPNSSPDDPNRRPAQGDQSSATRDFGDSAGYGSGGSTLDRHEVGDVPPDENRKPNPLDEVVKTGADRQNR